MVLFIFVKNLFYSLLSSAHSLKCYTCKARSAEECSTSQNVTTCDDRLRCAILTYDDHGFQYLKDCLWAGFCDVSKYLTNCTIQVCGVDYCNGPLPTTPSTKTTARPTTRSHAARSLLSGEYGMIVSVLVLNKILNICNIS